MRVSRNLKIKIYFIGKRTIILSFRSSSPFALFRIRIGFERRFETDGCKPNDVVVSRSPNSDRFSW